MYTLVKKSNLKITKSLLNRCFDDNLKLKTALEEYDDKYIGISADRAVEEAVLIIQRLNIRDNQ